MSIHRFYCTGFSANSLFNQNSVNPFRDLGIYTEDVLRRYQGKNLIEVGRTKFVSNW